MRLGELRCDGGTDACIGLSLQRMPAPIWQRVRHVHALLKKDSLTVTGRTKQFTRIADSGNEITGVFCPECGVRIYHALQSAPDVLALKPGTLDETSWLRPNSFIWMKSAQGWVPVLDDVEAIE